MSTFGRIEEFSEDKHSSWLEYAERLECFFVANDIVNAEKKKAVFLSVCGPATYSTLRSLLTPRLPNAVAYDDIMACLGRHYSPAPSPIVQRFNFHHCKQKPDQSIASYIAELKKLSVYCEFGDQLENMLRDRIVCGVLDINLQRRLLAEPNLTFAMAEEKAVSAETASSNARMLRPVEPLALDTATDVNQTQPSPRRGQRVTGDANKARKPCFRCGGPHAPLDCRFSSAVCHFCKSRGHIARVCMKKARTSTSSTATHVVELLPKQTDHPVVETDENYLINSLTDRNMHQRKMPYNATVTVNSKQLKMEVDSGAACSLISENTFNFLWSDRAPKLIDDDRVLKQWSSAPLNVLGKVIVTVKYRNRECALPLLVIQGHGTSLLGRDWFDALGIEVTGVHQVRQQSTAAILAKYAEVFAEDLGACQGPPVSIEVNPSIAPKFFKARPVPFALRSKVDEALDRLVEQGVFMPVKYSRWATPVVPVIKKDGSIRLCGDYRCTANTAVKPDTYPLPTVNELFATLAGGTVFTKLDLKQAYQQLLLDDDAAELLTINTHRGLLRALRLQFGVSTAVSIFQRFMDTLLAGIPGVRPYLDDILIAGRTQDEHDTRLDEVLHRFAESGLRVQKEKCSFAVPEVEYLGFRVTKDGISPTGEKVAAIQNAPTPSNKTELQAFLGLLNFYNCFLPNKATVLEPLHRLLDKSAAWKWTEKHSTAYAQAKLLIQAEHILVHYDEQKPLVLVCDASPYGLGALMSHIEPDGREAPVCFASRTLTSTERNYAQIDKEALAVVFAVKKFHQYLAGRSFVVYTDHKPLLGLLHHSKPMPQILSPRMLRWSLILGAYQYELCYRPGQRVANADALSRLPLRSATTEIPQPLEILLLEAVPDAVVHAGEIAALTAKDPVLSRVLRWILHGWPAANSDKRFSPFFSRRHEMSAHKDCVLWGNRVVIPLMARQDVLALLHDAHPGIVRMKGLARSYVWWPGMDTQIEEVVRECATCQMSRHNPPKAPLHPWEWSSRKWSRLHVDFAGPLKGRVFLIVVDSHSKWLEVTQMSSMSSAAVIATLRQLFATHGLPDVIVSDNGTAFTSAEFKGFTKNNGIRHVTVAPYHPSSNGQAERMVQTTKEALGRILNGDWQTRLARFLLAQHITPHSTTGKSPAEMLMGRRLTTALDRLHPDYGVEMLAKQEEAISKSQGSLRQFKEKEAVHMRHYGGGPKWVPGAVVEATGPLSYKVQTADGQVHRRHVDQLRGASPAPEAPVAVGGVPEGSLEDHSVNLPVPSPTRFEDAQEETQPLTLPSSPAVADLPAHPAQVQRPARQRVLPRRFQD